jgi:hypothetical protein
MGSYASLPVVPRPPPPLRLLERQLGDSQLQNEEMRVRMQAATAEREHMARLLEKEEVIVPQLQQRLTAVSQALP